VERTPPAPLYVCPRCGRDLDDEIDAALKEHPAIHAEKERDDARAAARSILQMAQRMTSSQIVADWFLDAHPWLKEVSR